MPKNKGKGGKNFKKGNHNNDETERELIFKQFGQEYGLIKKILGNNKLEVYCYDDITRVCNIRGNLSKKIWLSTGDIVLVNIREYQRNVGDIIHKYLMNEIKNLIHYDELPKNTLTLNINTDINNNVDIIFDINEDIIVDND